MPPTTFYNRAQTCNEPHSGLHTVVTTETAAADSIQRLTSTAMPGASTQGPDEAGSSGPADMPRALASDAASSEDLVGVAQADTQQQQETWVR